METQLLRTMRGLAAEKAKEQFPEFVQPAVAISKNPETGTHSIEFQGPHNILHDTLDAIHTLSDDPGNHKKKALLGLGIAGAGAGAMYAASRNKKFMKAFNKTAPSTLTGRILAAAAPAAIYYMLQNMDRPERAAAGASIAATAQAHKILNVAPNVSATVPASAQGALLANAAGSLGLINGYLMASSNFQKADDLKKLKMISEDPNLSDEEKRVAIDMIVSRKDFLTRYPAFRHAPYSERMRSMYNKAHGYGTVPDRNTASLDAMRGTADTFIREKIRE